MSIERVERQMFRSLDNAIYEIENASDQLADSLAMSYGCKGGDLLLELLQASSFIHDLQTKLRKYTLGELV